MHGMKGEMMKIGYPLPTIVAESTSAAFPRSPTGNRFFIRRYFRGDKGSSVAKALEESCKDSSVPFFASE